MNKGRARESEEARAETDRASGYVSVQCGEQAKAERLNRQSAGCDMRERVTELRGRGSGHAKEQRVEAQRQERAETRAARRISGGNGKRDPPVPIPNTEVKPLRADGTWLETARESRSLPDSNRSMSMTCSCFLYNENPALGVGFGEA